MIVSKKRKKIAAPCDVVPILRDLLSKDDHHTQKQEHFWVIGLNGGRVVQYVDLVTLGLVGQCHVHPREVFARLIEHHMSACIVAHNHPSGCSTPSNEDRAVTRQLKTAGEVLGISVLDHVIIGNDSNDSSVVPSDNVESDASKVSDHKPAYYSFAEQGVL